MISDLEVSNVMLEMIGKIIGSMACKMKKYNKESNRKGKITNTAK
jgi:hypothetical protein